MAERLDVQARVDYDGFALDVDHQFELSGITGLFGHSGCGKTTLLRTLSGLEGGAIGLLRVGSHTWLDSANGICMPAHQRGVGYVFQDVRLFPHLSVVGNLRFAERRAPRSRTAPAFEEVVEAFHLAPLLGRRTTALSGGESQRVAIARTLLTRPSLLLFDEPLAALDIRRKAEILPYIQSIPERFGISAIYVSHALDEMAALAERMVVLSAGRIVAHGSVAQVLERLDLGPVTGRFEAGVVLRAQVMSHDDEFMLTTLQHGTQSLEVPRIQSESGSWVRVRIRARDVTLALARPDKVSVRNMLSGTISELIEEPATAYAEALIDVGGAQIRARLTRRSVSDLALTPGTPVVAMVKSVALDRPSAAAMA